MCGLLGKGAAMGFSELWSIYVPRMLRYIFSSVFNLYIIVLLFCNKYHGEFRFINFFILDCNEIYRSTQRPWRTCFICSLSYHGCLEGKRNKSYAEWGK